MTLDINMNKLKGWSHGGLKDFKPFVFGLLAFSVFLEWV